MYLHPLRFLWKQLNGPQITAYMTALFRWFTDQFNPILSYLTEFSITSANEAHVTLIGACMQVARPLVEIADSSHFIFTLEPEHDKDYGVSAEPGPLSEGGVFSDLYEDLRNRSVVLCPIEYYRQILLSCARSPAQPFTLAYIDDFLASLWESYHPGETPKYTFTWYHSPSSSYSIGDIRLNLGPLDDWGGREQSILWQAILEGIINSVIGPTQLVEVVFTD